MNIQNDYRNRLKQEMFLFGFIAGASVFVLWSALVSLLGL